jgi:hypothetical protein
LRCPGGACVTGISNAALVSGAGRTDLEDIHIVFGGMRIAF